MNIALLLSGGVGTRMGLSKPKQYIEVNNRPIIYYCLERLLVHEEIGAVQIVADQEWYGLIRENIDRITGAEKFQGFSTPGDNRQLSIFHALEDIGKYAHEGDYVLIHDAARPLLSNRLITDCIHAAKMHDGAMPVLQMKDTVYLSRDGVTVRSLLERSHIFAGQAPEVFAFGAYYEANRRLLPEQILQIHGSTEPAVMAGMDIVMIPGEEENIKITTKEDLFFFQRKINQEKNS